MPGVLVSEAQSACRGRFTGSLEGCFSGAASAGQAEVLLWGPEIFLGLGCSETSSGAEVVHPDKGLQIRAFSPAFSLPGRG